MKRRRWFAVHSWLGVMAGLLLFVICWSGTLAVFAYEIDWLLNPLLRVTPQQERASWGQMHGSLMATYPDAQHVSLYAPLYDNFAATATIDIGSQKYLRVYIDPYTAEVLGQTSFFNVQRFFRSLHMCLFDPGRAGLGYWTVGVFGWLLLGSAITPLLFYRRWWRGFFTLKRDRGPRIFWSDAHKLTGVWGLWFVLTMGFTGAWYLLDYAGVELGYADPTPAVRQAASQLPLDTVLDGARRQRPDLRISEIHLPDDWNGQSLLIQGQDGSLLVRDRANRLYIDPSTGALRAAQRASDLGWPARWVDTADPVHFGDFGGLLTKAIWFVFGLALTGLCLVGAYLHYQRLQRERGRRRARWSGLGAATAASFVVLIVTAAGAWVEIRSYGPVDGSVQLWPDVSTPVVVFIAGWCAVTLAIIMVWSWSLNRTGRAPELRDHIALDSAGSK